MWINLTAVHLLTRALLLIFFLLLGTNTAVALEKEYVFAFNAHNVEEYEKFLDGRDPLAIKDLTSDNLTRHVMELVLFQHAIQAGGCDCKIVYKPRATRTSHARQIAEVREGRAIAHPIAGFVSDPRLKDKVMLSEPILQANEFYVGLYTHSTRDDVLNTTDIANIRKLRFTASQSWAVDNAVLRDNGFKIVPSDSWKSALNIIQLKRADVIMQPISPKDDFSFVATGTDEVFKPIPNVKLHFGGGRSYFVSKTHPDGKAFLETLNRGISHLRESGFLRNANKAVGLIDSRTDNWVVLNN